MLPRATENAVAGHIWPAGFAHFWHRALGRKEQFSTVGDQLVIQPLKID